VDKVTCSYEVRTLADSGCSCTIFMDRNLFTDYQPYSSTISTAGGMIRSTGRGTVGILQNCLCVSEKNINLMSTGQVLKQIPNLRFILKDEVFIIQDKTGRNANIVYMNVQDLCEISDLKWLGVDDDSKVHIANVAYNNIKMIKSYIESFDHEVYCAEMEKVKQETLRKDCTDEFANALQEVYITKVEALELLQRIVRMLQLFALTGISLDKKLLHQLVRHKCDICIRAIATD
jgi:hypothetical protein